MTKRQLLVSSLAVLVFIVASTLSWALLVAPRETAAVGMQGDAECLPDAAPDKCTCGPKFVPKKGCAGPLTKFMCTCTDITNGFPTTGKMCKHV